MAPRPVGCQSETRARAMIRRCRLNHEYSRLCVTRYYAAHEELQATTALMQAIIFDFDGLIIDTEDTDCRSWQELYAELGLRFPLDDWCATVGTTIRFDPFDELERQLGRVLDRLALQEQRRSR